MSSKDCDHPYTQRAQAGDHACTISCGPGVHIRIDDIKQKIENKTGWAPAAMTLLSGQEELKSSISLLKLPKRLLESYQSARKLYKPHQLHAFNLINF